MDGHRFDILTKRWATTAPRREAVRTFGAGTLALILASRTSAPAAATVLCEEVGCETVCENAIGPNLETCACLRKKGRSLCVANKCGKPCDKKKDCAPEEFCSKSIVKCCNKTKKFGRCAVLCKAIR